MQKQLLDIDPSAKEPLFRRLMSEESLGYLREKNSIVGFEIDLSKKQRLSGFALIAIQKHTIYAYRSDVGEAPRLVLFPSLEKLFDEEFDILRLKVIKKVFTKSDFKGRTIASGQFAALVKDLTPPEKKVDIADSIAERMAEMLERIQKDDTILTAPYDATDVPVNVTEKKVTPIDTPVEDDMDTLNHFEDEPDFNEMQDFDNYEEPSDDYEEDFIDDSPTVLYTSDEEETIPDEVIAKASVEAEIVEDIRTSKLKSQSFEALSDVSEYVSNHLGVPKAIAIQVVNSVLQSPVAPEQRIVLAIKLFAKLFDEKKV